MNLFLWIIFGGIVGVVSYVLDKREAKGGMLGGILFGIFGAMSGGVLAHLLFGIPATQFDLAIFLMASAGALFLLIVQHTVFTKEEKF